MLHNPNLNGKCNRTPPLRPPPQHRLPTQHSSTYIPQITSFPSHIHPSKTSQKFKRRRKGQNVHPHTLQAHLLRTPQRRVGVQNRNLHRGRGQVPRAERLYRVRIHLAGCGAVSTRRWRGSARMFFSLLLTFDLFGTDSYEGK